MIEAVQLGGCVRQQVFFFLFALKKKRNNEIRRIVCATRTENRTGIEIEGGGVVTHSQKNGDTQWYRLVFFRYVGFLFGVCVVVCAWLIPAVKNKQQQQKRKKKQNKNEFVGRPLHRHHLRFAYDFGLN